MKQFKKPDNSLWAFDSDGSQDAHITADMMPLTDAEFSAMTAPSFVSQKTAEIIIWTIIRDKYAGRLASIASRLYTSDPAGAASADAVATSLLGLFADPAVVAATDIAAYKLALKARYTQAVMLATASARAEFGRYDK